MRPVAVREVFRVLKDLCRFERGAGYVRPKAWIAPRIRPSELGASPKFKIITFYGQVRVFKHYSPIAWFVVLSASLEGPNYGKKSPQVYPEHPSTSGMGAEADDWPSLNF